MTPNPRRVRLDPCERVHMDRAGLIAWANQHADGGVTATPDYQLSLSSKLIRFHWNDAPTIAVGADADGKTRINALLDAIAFALGQPGAPAPAVHLLLGVDDTSITEHLDAIGTLTNELRDGPTVRVWTIRPGEEPVEIHPKAATFTTDTPGKWAGMLAAAAMKPVDGMAAAVAEAFADRPSFALYPKLSSMSSTRPWQMRLDGLEIGRTGPSATILHLASKDLTKPTEPRSTWLKVVGPVPLTFGPDQLGELVSVIDRLIDTWTHPSVTGAVLGHGQAEHALEAHLLSGRLTIGTPDGPLRLAVPFRSGMLAAAQFPTLWGNVTRPARYLDALLADTLDRPWAVELKDQGVGGGHGAYLRHGIGQAVLYRHYIRNVAALDAWFDSHNLGRTECQAALAFPTAPLTSASAIGRLRALATLFDVDVIEFGRPGH